MIKIILNEKFFQFKSLTLILQISIKKENLENNYTSSNIFWALLLAYD